MPLKHYLLLMVLGTALAWSAVALVIGTTDPTTAQPLIFGAFYVSLFLALTGTFSVAGFILRIGLLKQQLVVSRHVAISFRQAILLALLVVTALFLQSQSLLTWWSAIIIVMALTLLEFILISAQMRR
jgi:hypothetical protein